MPVFPNFFGNDRTARTLLQMAESGRIAQTIILAGPAGVGRATLARRFAAHLLGSPEKIEADDLSLAANQAIVEEREKWTSEQRADDPLFFGTHPDFITFPPDGPLRQITMQQMRLLRERAQLKPLKGSRRVFLIDGLERANEQSANSLLKLLEEPPEHLVLICTVENLYDTLPTIRSRAVIFQMCRLADAEITSFLQLRSLPQPEVRAALAEGCPGLAATLDVESILARRELMLSAFEAGAGLSTFADWVQKSESFSSKKAEKLDLYLKLAYNLLSDLVRVTSGRAVRQNRDIQDRINRLASRVTFAWMELVARELDELVLMIRRNIQKTPAMDAFVASIRSALPSEARP